MQQKIHLFFDGSNHPGMTMTGGTDRYACCKIEESIAVYIFQPKASGFFNHKRITTGV
jgi:hypothetical protein